VATVVGQATVSDIFGHVFSSNLFLAQPFLYRSTFRQQLNPAVLALFTGKKCRAREGNLDTRGIWILVMFKTSYLFSLSYTQLMKTVSGSFDTVFCSATS